MTDKRWTRQRFDQRVAERKAESKLRGETESIKHLAMEGTTADIINDYEAALAAKDAEIEQLKAQLATDYKILSTAISVDEKDIDAGLSVAQANVIAELRTEYRALWDAVIAYCNAPEESSNVEYAALVAMAMNSRFQNEASTNV